MIRRAIEEELTLIVAHARSGQLRAAHLYATLPLAATPRAAQVAQLVEHVTENHGVGGSIPPLGTTLDLILSGFLAGKARVSVLKSIAVNQHVSRDVRLSK